MTTEEYAVVAFLNTSPESYFARKEIARKAVRRQVYDENPHWADAPLASLLIQGVIEQNGSGQYRMKGRAE